MELPKLSITNFQKTGHNFCGKVSFSIHDFKMGYSNQIQQGSVINVLESSSNFCHLFVSMKKTFPEDFSFIGQFILTSYWKFLSKNGRSPKIAKISQFFWFLYIIWLHVIWFITLSLSFSLPLSLSLSLSPCLSLNIYIYIYIYIYITGGESRNNKGSHSKIPWKFIWCIKNWQKWKILYTFSKK